MTSGRGRGCWPGPRTRTQAMATRTARIRNCAPTRWMRHQREVSRLLSSRLPLCFSLPFRRRLPHQPCSGAWKWNVNGSVTFMQHHSDRTHQSGLTGKGGAWGKWKMFYGERSVFLWLDLREDTPEASVLQACLKERKEKKKTTLTLHLHYKRTRRLLSWSATAN